MQYKIMQMCIIFIIHDLIDKRKPITGMGWKGIGGVVKAGGFCLPNNTNNKK